MEASELRIGNLLHFIPHPLRNNPNERVVVVSAIDKKQVVVTDMGLDLALNITDKEIAPISLTEEKLMEFGLIPCTEKHRPGYYKLPSDDRYYFVWNSISNSITAVGVGQPDNENIYMFAWKVKYAHSLQNLIFALTGEELTIKE